MVSHLSHHWTQGPPPGGEPDQGERSRRGGVPRRRRTVRAAGGAHPLAGGAPPARGLVLPRAHRARTRRAAGLDHLLRDGDSVLRIGGAAQLPPRDAAHRVDRLRADAGRRGDGQRGGVARPVHRDGHLLRADEGGPALLPRPAAVRGRRADRVLRVFRHPGDRARGAHLRGLHATRHLRGVDRRDHRGIHRRLGGHHPHSHLSLVDRRHRAYRHPRLQDGVVGDGSFVAADQRRRPRGGVVRDRGDGARREADLGEGEPTRVPVLHPVPAARERPSHAGGAGGQLGVEDLQHQLRDVPRGARQHDPRHDGARLDRGGAAPARTHQRHVRVAAQGAVGQPGVLRDVHVAISTHAWRAPDRARS